MISSPQYTALLDQADAAARQDAHILAELAKGIGGPITEGRPTGPAATVEQRFLDRLARRQLTRCPNLTGNPEPLWWTAWRPGRLRCAWCAQQAGIAVKGTIEDLRCDHCKRVTTGIYPGASQFPALVFSLRKDQPARAFGPVTCLWGLVPVLPGPIRGTRPRPQKGSLMTDYEYTAAPGQKLRAEDMAVLFDVPLDEFRSCVGAQNTGEPELMIRFPRTWVERGRSRADVYRQATESSDLAGAVEFWKAQRDVPNGGLVEVACSACAWTQPTGRFTDHGTTERPGCADCVDAVMPRISEHIDNTGHDVLVTLMTFTSGQDPEVSVTRFLPRVA